MSAVQGPPGWPPGVPPPGAPGWEPAAASWLLDLCPAEYRGYPVLRRYPVALAWLAVRHVEADRLAVDRAIGAARSELGGVLAPPAVRDLLEALEQEQARLLGAARAVRLIDSALRSGR